MTVLDANAVLAALRREPAAEEVEAILRTSPRISAVNMAEVVDVFVRRFGATWPELAGVYEHLRVGGLEIVPADEEMAMFAGEIRARYYRRAAAALSIADCFALATANTCQADLATADPAIARVAREIGFGIHALPDSRGKLP